jgi:hypothetical protein
MPKLKPALIAIPVLLLVVVVGFFVTRNGSGAVDSQTQTAAATPKPKVNLIEIAKRPYVTLEPLSARNELQLTVHTLPLAAKDMEVLLEYDRNKGVMDAVLKSFTLTNLPSVHKIFLGSKSTGGHVTYHDDVVGGKLVLTFSGQDEPYSLEVPWRYDDTQPRYTQISTSDLKFQLILDEPYRTPKILVMQSPGLPTAVDGQVLAGPYLVRGVGVLPNITGQLTIRLPQAEPEARLLIFDGQTWQPQTSTVTDHTLTASVPLASVYVVVK